MARAGLLLVACPLRHQVIRQQQPSIASKQRALYDIMFCLHRALFFAITLLVCVVIAAPVVQVEHQQVVVVANQEHLVASHMLQAEPASSGEGQQEESVGARVL